MSGKNLEPNLNTGMTNMDKNSLKAREICSIIEACKSSGIKTLEFGELKLEFSPQGPVESVPGQVQAIHYQQDVNLDNVEEAKEDGMAMLDEQIAEDALYAQMLIDDPAGYEKLQIAQGMEQSRVVNEAL